MLIQMLGGAFQGVLCSDRFSAYLKYHKGRAQFCWAHLKRTLLGIVEFTKSNAVERFAAMCWPNTPNFSGCGTNSAKGESIALN